LLVNHFLRINHMTISMTINDIESLPPFLLRALAQAIEARAVANDPRVTPEAAFAQPVAAAPEPTLAPAPVTPPPPPGIDVDSAGLPWDGRIHAGSRSKNADGTWRLKRGVEPDLLTQVAGELKRTMEIPAAVIPPPPIVQPAAVPVPPAAVTPPPSTPVGPATTASPISFPALMQAITKAFVAKTIDQAAITAACQSVGIPSLPMLTSRPDLIPGVATALGLAL
jgi:hypothetical protein